MELLNWWAADVVATSLLVSGLFSLAVSYVAFRVRPSPRPIFWTIFFAAFSFALLGFVIGELLGDSRDSAVGSVVPAVLTLLAGVVAYIMSSKGLRTQTTVSAVLLSFTFTFLVGSLFGIRLRIEYNDARQNPQYLAELDLALERNKLVLEVQRLQDYVAWLRLRSMYERKDSLDLSKFQSAFEKSKAEKPPAAELNVSATQKAAATPTNLSDKPK